MYIDSWDILYEIVLYIVIFTSFFIVGNIKTIAVYDQYIIIIMFFLLFFLIIIIVGNIKIIAL